uniref:Uncharacterized protein n=1 Tax=Heliothis virescens TaxID=7102 RepID=A0A2A4J5I8_HELVI
MECFLAGVRPATSADTPRDRWHPQAIERFEELTQVARWKPLMSKTCTYKKTATAEGEKEREIPGIKLFDNTDEGELDIGATLIAEGWAEHGPGDRPSPTQHRPPFGDLGNSRVLGMLEGGRCSSVPKDHRDTPAEVKEKPAEGADKDNERMTTSKSLGSGLETGDKPLSISNFDLSYPDNSLSKAINGSHENFLHIEKQNLDKEGNLDKGSADTLVPPVPSTPILAKSPLDEFKANMNRIDSHHSNLEFLARSQHENNNK